MHETAAGALWNLAFNPGNALRIVEEGGVLALVHLCSSSVSKMARFMSALALAYMFDGRYMQYSTSILIYICKGFSSNFIQDKTYQHGQVFAYEICKSKMFFKCLTKYHKQLLNKLRNCIVSI